MITLFFVFPLIAIVMFVRYCKTNPKLNAKIGVMPLNKPELGERLFATATADELGIESGAMRKHASRNNYVATLFSFADDDDDDDDNYSDGYCIRAAE